MRKVSKPVVKVAEKLVSETKETPPSPSKTKVSDSDIADSGEQIDMTAFISPWPSKKHGGKKNKAELRWLASQDK